MIPQRQQAVLPVLILFAATLFTLTVRLRAQDPIEKLASPHFFVSLEQLQTLIQRDKKWVLLTQDEFQKLQEAAKLNAGKPQPPASIGVGEVKYAAKIEEDQLVLQATMQITKFAPGWQALPLEFTDLSLEKATLDDQPARLGRDSQAGGRLTLLLDQPGKKTLTLQLSRPLIAVGSDKLATFGLPRHSGVELTLDLGAEKHLQWNGLPVERPAANDQPARYQLAVGGQKQVELKITDRPTQQSSEGLVFAHSAIGVRAAPEEVTWQAIVSLQVFGKPLDSLQFRVPEALQIVSITSPGLESWEFGPNGPENGETVLNLRYRQTFQEPREVTIQAVMAAKTSEGWLVPSLKLSSVASHTADVLVSTAPGTRLQLEEAVGVQRTANTESDAATAAGGMRFTAWREDFLLRFTTQPRAREVSAAIVTLLDINSDGLNLKSNVTVETRFAPLFEVLMSLPAEWTVTDVLVNQARVAWETVPQEAGVHQIQIPFATPLAPDQQAIIQLQAHRDPEGWPIEDGKVAISLPEVRLVQSNVVEGTVMVAAELDLDIEPEQVKGLSPAMLDKSVAARLAYEYQDTHYSGQIQVSRKISRIAARTLAFHRLDKETLLSHLEARLDIQGGGTRKLVFSLPEAAGTNLRFEVSECLARIVEQSASEPVKGRRNWTLLLDQRVRGGLLAVVDVSQPRNKATDFTPPTLQVVGAERETGAIAFEAEPDQELDLTVTDSAKTPLPDVDPTDLPLPTAYVPKDRIVAAYGFVLPDYELKLAERRYDRLAVPTAICDKLNIVSILGETGEFQHEAAFNLRAVGVQSLQVNLPEGAQLWATLLDATPIEVRHTSTAYLIPLRSLTATGGDESQQTRTLKLFYRTDAGVLKPAAQLSETPPAITVLNGDGTEQPLEILQQEWTVHHPRQTEFVSSPGNFQTDQPQTPVSFLGRMLNQFAVDSPDKLLWKLAALLGVVVIISIVRLVIARTGVLGLVGAASTIGLLLLLYSIASEQQKSVQFFSDGVTATTEKRSAPAAAARSQVEGFKANVEAMDSEEAEMAKAIESPTQQFGDFLPPMKDQNRLHDRVTSPRSMPSLAGNAMERDVASAKPDEAREVPKSEEKKESGAAPQEIALRQKGMQQQDQLPVPVAGPAVTNPEPKLPEDGKPRVNAPDQRQAGGVPAPAKPQPQPAADQAPLPQQGVAQQAAPQRGALQGGTNAVLSLALNLEPPANSQSTHYAYRGRNATESAHLVINYQNRARLSFVTLVLQVLVVLGCWLVRNRSVAFRLLVLSIGIAIPLAAITIVPANWLPFLDGIFGGTLWGGGLLATHACLKWVACRVNSPGSLWKLLATPITHRSFILVALVWSCSGPTLQAQEQGTQRAAEIATQAIAQPTPAPASPPPTTLLVPLMADLEAEKSDRVFLPHDKFLELWKQAHPDEPQATESPFPGLISEAVLAAELVPPKGDTKPFVKVTARFVCYSFREGQVTLPLPVGKVAVVGAKLDGESAPLVNGTDADSLAILLTRPGVHIVDLIYSVPVELTGPAGKFTLQLGAVSAGILRLTAPAADLIYRVNGSSGAFRRTKAGDQQIVLIPISNGGEILVSWRPLQSRGDVEAIVHVDSVTALLLIDEGTRLISAWNFQVRQGSCSEILFALPESLGVRKIEGPDVGGWEVAGEGENRQLKIFLRRKVEDVTQLKFDLFVKQKPDDLETLYELPPFAPKNITRETGTVAVLADKQFGVRVTKIQGLSQIEPQQVPLQRLAETLTAGNVLSYRFATRPYQLEIAVKRRQPQLKVQARHHGHLDPRKVHILSRLKFNLLGAPRSSLAMLLPQGYLLQDVQADDASDWHVSGREDSAQMDAEAQLFLEFPTPRTGSIEIVLIGKTLRQPDVLKAEVNLPYPLEVDELDTQLLVTVDPIYSAKIGGLDNWKSIDPSNLAQALLGRDVTSGQFGFSSNTPAPAPIPVELTQEIPKLSANVMTLLTVGEESLDYLFAMQWKIDTAGADTFVFTTPDSLAGKLEFPEGLGPRRRGIVQEAIANNRTRWTVTLEDPQRERFFLIARTVLPPAENGLVHAPSIRFEQRLPGQDPPQIEPLETQAQYVVLVNQSQTQLTSATPDSVETIPADDLLQIIKLRQDLVQQAAEIVRVKTPQAPVSWKQQRFQAEQMLPASVNLAHHITVLAADSSWREQVVYRLRNRSRQFLAIRLPADSQVLSLFVKGLPARPVQSSKDPGFTLIPLPKTTEGDVSFEVHLVLAGHLQSETLPRRWVIRRPKIEIPVPAVVTPEESPEYGIPVAQSTWTVYAPQDLDVEIVKDSDVTNVSPVSETLQSYDQASALLSDVSELINVNSSTYNRRAKAQSLNNLKQLNVTLSQSVKGNRTEPNNSQEQAKQQDLERRVSQLQESIDKLVVANSAAGLTISNDSDGNAIVVDNNAGQEGQAGRINELFTDNGAAVTIQADPNAADFTAVQAKSEGKPAAEKPQAGGKKGNLNRGELRGRNSSQVQALSDEQIKSNNGQQPANSDLNVNPSSAQRYFFQNGPVSGLSAGQGNAVPGAYPNGSFPAGPGRDLIRQGDLPKLGTIVGLEAGSRVYLGRSGPMVAGGGMGGMGGGIAANAGVPQLRGLDANADGVFGELQGRQNLPQVWSSSGGLSLLIEIPTNGQKLSFSKVGGEPRLMLKVRPHQTLQLALGLVWTVVWSLILLVVCLTLRRPQATAVLTRQLPWFIAGLGMMLYCMVPSQALWGNWGLVAFIAGVIWIAFQPARHAVSRG